MIVPMKRVSLVVLAYEKRSALKALRRAGIVHVDEIPVRSEKLEDLNQSKQQMQRIINRLQELPGTPTAQEALSNSEFAEMHARVVWLFEQQKKIEEQRQKMLIESERIRPWGDFSPSSIQELKAQGVELRFYLIGKGDLARLDSDLHYIRLASNRKNVMIAVIDGLLPQTISAQKLELPEYSLSELEAEINSAVKRLASIKDELQACANYLPDYKHHLTLLEQDERFEKVSVAMEGNDTVVWLSGYLPTQDVDSFKTLASEQRWAYALDDPGAEEQPPTLVENKRWIAIIDPVFKILGTVPGYREFDISMWFLMFFAIFFAMIVGDAAYGLIFLIFGIGMHIKQKKATNATLLLYVLSITSIAWGSITGTWFGSKAVLEALPFLQSLVIPQLASYPELFGLEATTTQDMVMQLCFIIGTMHLSLACAMNIYRKVGQKDLSAVADFGWLIMIDALYFLVLMLVINTPVPVTAVAAVVGAGFLLVVLFGAQGPNISFWKGLAGGATNMFSTFLNSISAFSNIISYIRLFAVGMASLAIAQSFNGMASGLLQGFAFPAGVLVLVIGHGLNLVMALLSVVVHGVRLNLLEFSGQLGMEWTGFTYDPFRETVETSSKTL
ncbi:MAG: ATPase [Sphaerochaetaceae bacterium]